MPACRVQLCMTYIFNVTHVSLKRLTLGVRSLYVEGDVGSIFINEKVR